MATVPLVNLPPPLWRQTLLKSNKISQAAIAEEAGVPESTVSRVIANTYWSATKKGQAKRDAVRKAMAKLLKLKVEQIFPADEVAATAPPEPAAKARRVKR